MKGFKNLKNAARTQTKQFLISALKILLRRYRKIKYHWYASKSWMPKSPPGLSISATKMKILFISLGDMPDYLNDMVYHGIKTNEKFHLEEINPLKYLYQGYHPLHKLYGRGFTLYGRLESKPYQIDRWQMASRVNRKHYDKIIFGSIWRYNELMNIITSIYDKSDVIILDGEDHEHILKRFVGCGKYFKREYTTPMPGVSGINFSIPEELILKKPGKKVQKMATIIPGKKETYVYKNEHDYYNGYANSIFGTTFQKSGWDCLRHYEILMNGCIPYFPDLEFCPSLTMPLFPKKIILETNQFFEQNTDFNFNTYTAELLEITRRSLTTIKVAEKLIFE